MPYAGLPQTSPRDAVYLTLGLIEPTQSLLTDAEVDYFLSKNTDHVIKTCIDCARVILFKLSQMSRSRNDMLEVYDDQKFMQWSKALSEFIKSNDPESASRSIATALTNANGYAGNISASDMLANDSNLDNVLPSDKVRNFEPTYSNNPFMI
jgi:hypothetical protein